MTENHGPTPSEVLFALSSLDVQQRFQAALAAGTEPMPEYIEVLIERSGIESDFFVREMLTWALVRQPAKEVLALLIDESHSQNLQARSQSLHTLSKIGDPGGWVAISAENLHHRNDDVARTAWRAAVVLVPEEQVAWLEKELILELGRGNRDVMLSLSRALIELRDEVLPALWEAQASNSSKVQAHAFATEQLFRDPESTFSI